MFFSQLERGMSNLKVLSKIIQVQAESRPNLVCPSVGVLPCTMDPRSVPCGGSETFQGDI